MRKPVTQRIKELEERRRALQARLNRHERAQATRRRIVLGSFILERLERSGDVSGPDVYDIPCDLRQWLRRGLAAFLTRDADRDLFADLLDDCRTAQGATGDGAVKGNAQHSSVSREGPDTSQADVIEDDA